MDKAIHQRILFCEKQNDFKKGNKNNKTEMPVLQKWSNKRQYQSIQTIMLQKPICLKRKIMTNTSQFCELYGEQIHKQNCNTIICERFLAKHEINSYLRAKMVDWMIEVTASYRFTSKTYFDSVQIMDRYFQAQSDCLSPQKLHLIGVQCMLVASKMNEIFPLKIKTVFQKIGHCKLPIQDIVQMQERIMKKLEYKLNSWTFFDLTMFKISQYFQHEELRQEIWGKIIPSQKQAKKLPEYRKKRMEDLCSFICKHLVFDYDFICEHSTITIAQSCVVAVLQIMNISSIPVSFYFSSPIILEITKQKIYKIMKKFKGSFANLNNIFKFTSDEVLSQIAEFS